ncbi:hypothetical protein OEZ85_012387 [Tetradesmus obliquus]|uniref:Peptidase M16 N-terminal domain-containing protein n=1 Tax=Tetradesmus obliquus TaxID=3088 RepID=A0ABY8TXY5_TETOB|nr:hypothetical protein OEZ85_012387 [Tetradesmus obliquus]
MGHVYRELPEVDLSGDIFTSKVPLGPEGLLHGRLDNGLTYYVRQCSKPKARAALALAVKVGSLVEEEPERGVAHILEHLAFNATQRYSNHDIVAFLESIGASFGACQNAYTSADETVYTLMVPTAAENGDNAALLEESIAVLSEFAARIRCAPEDLAKERGAVMEELRMCNDSGGRLAAAHWKLLLQGCRYENRLPIGLESVIKRVPAEAIAAFYRRWYLPHRMAVVAVGDFPDCAAVLSLITKHLGPAFEAAAAAGLLALQGGPEVPRVLPDSWQHSEPRFCVFADREAQDSGLYLSWKVPSRPTATPAQYLEVMKDVLFQACLNGRLYRLSRARDPPFFSASLADESACAAVDMFVLGVVCEEKQTLRALEAVLVELARVRLHGFSQREFSNAVKSMQADIETTYLEADQGYCTDIRDEYVRHFLGEEFVSGQQYEARLNKTLLPLISVEDINARAATLTHRHSAVFKSVEHKKWHSEAALRKVVEAVAADEAGGAIGPWEEPDMPDSIMKQIPQVPEEWYTCCGLEPPDPSLPIYPSMLLDAESAAAVADSLAGSFKSCSSCSAQHGGSSGIGEPAAAAAAAAAVEEVLEELTAAVESSSDQQQETQQEQQQPQAAEQQIQAVPRQPGGMLYPGVVSERLYPQLQLRELTLANGMRLAIKETDFLADEVLVTAVAVGGLSEVPRPSFYTASMSGVVGSQLGQFGHKPEVLGELLAGRRLSLSPSEGAYARSVKGSASPHDLEVVGQLLHSLMTYEMQLEPGEMDSVMLQVRQGIEAQLRSPLHAYHSRVRQVNYDACYFFDPITLEELDKVDLEASCSHHRYTFSNPAEFTVVFTGNVKFTALLPVITTYLATIPAAPGRGGPRDCRTLTPLPFKFPEQPVVEDVEVDMVSPLTQSQITLPVGLERAVAREQLWWLSAACRLLETRLLQKLRFEFGDVYTVSVASFFGCEAPSSTGAKLWGDVSIAFTCDPANKERLVELALTTLERLQEEGPTQAEVDTLLNVERFDWENLQQENSFWHDVVVNGYQSRKYAEGGDLDAVWARIRDSRDEVMAEMTPQTLQAMLCRLFPHPCRSRYTAITMMPRPPGLIGLLAFRWATASSSTQIAVAAAGVGVLVAAAAAAVVVARRRAAQ